MTTPDFVFLGICGSVVALDKKTGAHVWETKLKGDSFVTLLVDNSQILAGAQGEVFCLDAATGKTLWHDGLKGYRFGLMSIATKNGSSDSVMIAAEQKRQQNMTNAGSVGATG